MRIPGGENFGNVAPVAPYQMRDPDRPEAASGAIIGRAITGAAEGYIAAERQEQEAARRLRDAADEATARGAMVAGRDQISANLDDYNAKVISGEIKKSDAVDGWSRNYKEFAPTVMEGVPQAHKKVVQQDLDHRAAMGTRAVGKAVMLRDQQDVRAGIDQTFEHASRLYSSDPAASDSMAREVLSLAGAAGMTPVQAQAKLQGHLEATRENAAVKMVNDARHSNKALNDVVKALKTEAFDPLDEKKRTGIYNTIENYKFNNDRAAEAQARQAMARQEHQLKVADSAIKSANDQALLGALSHEYIEQTRRAVKGTPAEASFTALLDNQARYGSFASRPLTEQAATVAALEQRQATAASPDVERQLREVKRVQAASKAAAEKDATSAYLARSGQPPLRLNMTTNAGQLVEQLQSVKQLATDVSRWSGKPESGLTNEQAVAFGGMLQTMPAAQRSALLVEVAKAVGPQVSIGLASQLDGENDVLSHQLMYASNRTSLGRSISEMIGLGAEAKTSGTSTKGDANGRSGVPSAEWGATIAQYLGDPYANAKVNSKVKDAAEYIAHAIAAEGGGNITRDDLHRAARIAAGGQVIEHNGVKTLVDVGLSSAAIGDKLRTIDPAQITDQAHEGSVLAGGEVVPVERFLKALPGRQLVKDGDGVYVVYDRGRPVRGKGGQAVRVRLK